MSNTVSIIVAWVLVIGVLGAYGFTVIARGKSLAKKVPEDRQRWMTTKAPEESP